MVTRQEAIGRYAVLQQRNFFYEADSGDDEDLAKLHALTGCDREEDVSDRVIDELRRKYVGSSDDEEQQQPLQVPEKSSFASIGQFKFMGGNATHGSESLSSGPSGVPQAASESHNRDLRDEECRQPLPYLSIRAYRQQPATLKHVPPLLQPGTLGNKLLICQHKMDGWSSSRRNGPL